MYFEQFYLTCLAHASYMIGSAGEAAVVDPQRDVDIYLKAAAEQKLKIRHIFETHLHADFVSGHKELAARTGATIYIGSEAKASFPHTALRDGDEVRVGAVRIRALATPGHTPEGMCFVVNGEENSPANDSSQPEQPYAVLTGDTLFIGDVGRPDLSPTHTPQELAGLLYDSLHGKLLTLPDATLVYPAHGAGSLCGRAMRAEKCSTIGTERLTNYALQIKSREEFIRQLTTNLPTRPTYFAEDAAINRLGASALTELAPLGALSPQEVQSRLRENAWVLDVRDGNDFAAGHVPGSVNIALSGQFASWAGALLGIHSNPILVADSAERIEEARLRLARVGIEELQGYLEGGVMAWREAVLPVLSTPQISAEELHRKLRGDESGLELSVLDVRREGEWQAGHIGEAAWHALDSFPTALPRIEARGTVAVHCKSGYRSMIACSLLERAGHRNVVNLVGGFDAWHNAGLPEVMTQAPALTCK
ncbi:MAG: rhodanese-like domain-containing protein [Terriglobales bacterium]